MSREHGDNSTFERNLYCIELSCIMGTMPMLHVSCIMGLCCTYLALWAYVARILHYGPMLHVSCIMGLCCTYLALWAYVARILHYGPMLHVSCIMGLCCTYLALWAYVARIIFTTAIEVRIPAGAMTFHVTNHYIKVSLVGNRLFIVPLNVLNIRCCNKPPG